MKLNNNIIIYMVCPAFYKTGGTELAHQFVYEANKLGYNAIIAYIPNDSYNELCNPAFKQYINKYVTIDQIEDCEENLLILPETNIYLIDNFNKIRKSIWWMSVDNYLKNSNIFWHYKYYGFLRTIKWILKKKKIINLSNLDKDKIMNFYQSEYARLFLEENGFNRCYQLSDYINEEYLSEEYYNNKNRKDIVLYNPKKGYKFTKKIIKNNPDITCVPLINLSNLEVKKYLTTSKVYIDFGTHPGKDRFPREAAICGCCIITGKEGAAKNNIDIPINEEFKFYNKSKEINLISKKIKECIDNYDKESVKFNYYREKIKQEHHQFIEDIKAIKDILNEN